MDQLDAKGDGQLDHPDFGYYIPQGTTYFCIWWVQILSHFKVGRTAEVQYKKVEMLWSWDNYRATGAQNDINTIFRCPRDIIAFDLTELKGLYDRRFNEVLKAIDVRKKALQDLIKRNTDELGDEKRKERELMLDTPPWGQIEFKVRTQGATKDIKDTDQLKHAWSKLETRFEKDGSHD